MDACNVVPYMPICIYEEEEGARERGEERRRRSHHRAYVICVRVTAPITKAGKEEGEMEEYALELRVPPMRQTA